MAFMLHAPNHVLAAANLTGYAATDVFHTRR
jgi:hypothetical protein